ncbi:MAG TPA: MaoC family dehydratase N-terminal domain-containing protein [Mycobacteriales bacterium]|jgi:acyl dehydratase|nr:MaoC family dehydratase N-terminal domain-containing protein [Mycobacteriales bacterium]
MPINRACLGKTYPPARTFEVGREHIRQFAAAIGDLNPAYLDPEAARALGYRDVIAPPTYLMSVMSLAGGGSVTADPELNLDRPRVVHAEQQFVHHRPVHPGDVLSLTVKVDAIETEGKNERLVLRQDFTDATGELVCTAYFNIVSRGTAQPAESGA